MISSFALTLCFFFGMIYALTRVSVPHDAAAARITYYIEHRQLWGAATNMLYTLGGTLASGLLEDWKMPIADHALAVSVVTGGAGAGITYLLGTSRISDCPLALLRSVRY